MIIYLCVTATSSDIVSGGGFRRSPVGELLCSGIAKFKDKLISYAMNKKHNNKSKHLFALNQKFCVVSRPCGVISAGILAHYAICRVRNTLL